MEKDSTVQNRPGQTGLGLARVRDTWGHCRLEGGVTKFNMGKDKSGGAGKSQKIKYTSPKSL